MRVCNTCPLLFLFLAATGAGAAIDPPRKIDYPGALNTAVSGIHGNLLVGRYWDDPEQVHGFIFDGFQFHTLDYPNSSYSALFDVEDTRVVGSFVVAARQFGFSYDQGAFSVIDPPDTSTDCFNGSGALGVSGSYVVGGYFDVEAKSRGFIFDGSNYSPFDYPGALSTSIRGVDGERLVGLYSLTLQRHGFYFDGVDLLTIDHPLALQPHGTNANDISGPFIVGTFGDAPNVSHGFVLKNGTFEQFDVPAAWGTQTDIQGVDGHAIVGQYLGVDGRYHGFYTTIPEPTSGASLLFGIVVGLLAKRKVAQSSHHPLGATQRT
jgi:hypothetical protein